MQRPRLPDDAAPVYVIPFQNLRLDTAEAQTRFRRRLLGLAPLPRLLVMDTAISVGGSVNFLDPGQVRAWMAFWRGLALDLGGLVVLLFHVPKWIDKQPRLASLFGSVDFGASLDFAFATVPLDGAGTFRLCAVKNTWGIEKPDLTFRIETAANGGIVLTAGPGGVRSLLLSNVGEDWTPGADLTREVEAAGYTGRAARDALAKLSAEGTLECRADPANRRWRQWRTASPEAPA